MRGRLSRRLPVVCFFPYASLVSMCYTEDMGEYSAVHTQYFQPARQLRYVPLAPQPVGTECSFVVTVRLSRHKWVALRRVLHTKHIDATRWVEEMIERCVMGR